ncbi:MAG TPA: transglutaminase domain-containing protein [Burkholderiales bacterium]
MLKSDALPPEAARTRRIESVRLRNALLLQPSTSADFSWTPAQVPAGFEVERRAPTPLFAQAVARLGIDELSDWDKARALAAHLTACAQDKGPIQSDLATTYRRIREGYGYCADFAKVYVALAHAAGLFVRQWAFTHNGFGGNGHVLIEVYDPLRGKWLMLDVYNNFYAIDAASNQVLSALEFRDSVLGLRAPAIVRPLGAGRPGFIHHARLLEYYRRGAGEWYLIWGNAVYSAESNPVVRAAIRLHPAAGQLAAMLFRAYPGIRLYVTAGNRAAAEALADLGRSVRLALWSAVMLGVGAVAIALFASRAP